MLHVPARFATILVAFAPVFVQARTWQHAQMLVLGALLVPGQRTVCNILRIVGLRQEQHFVTYHRVLNRAVWDSRLATRLGAAIPLLSGNPRSGQSRAGRSSGPNRTRGYPARAAARRIGRAAWPPPGRRAPHRRQSSLGIELW